MNCKIAVTAPRLGPCRLRTADALARCSARAVSHRPWCPPIAPHTPQAGASLVRPRAAIAAPLAAPPPATAVINARGSLAEVRWVQRSALIQRNPLCWQGLAYTRSACWDALAVVQKHKAARLCASKGRQSTGLPSGSTQSTPSLARLCCLLTTSSCPGSPYPHTPPCRKIQPAPREHHRQRRGAAPPRRHRARNLGRRHAARACAGCRPLS
jgi:hypothetical protein